MTPVSTGTESLELMDHQLAWDGHGMGSFSGGSVMERGNGSIAPRQVAGCPEVGDRSGW